MNIGEKIKFLRNSKKMSQKKLASLSGVSENAIRKYEAGSRNPKTDTLKKLATALGVSETTLYDLDFSPVDNNTIGEFMSLFLMLEKQVGFKYSTLNLPNGIPEHTGLLIQIENNKISECIYKWQKIKSEVAQKRYELELLKSSMSENEYSAKLAELDKKIELTRLEILENSDEINDL